MTHKKCEHGKQKSHCKECDGSAFCKHGRQKGYCKECGSYSFCEHGKRKDKCKECGGSAFCEHRKWKRICRDCSGSTFCEHGKLKSHCKDCGGSAFCEHGKQKSQCRECGGSTICEHGKRKDYCRECGGSSFCEHKKQKRYCKECGGSAFCEHGKQKRYCILCNISAFCEHEKQKRYCKECGGSIFCEHGKQKSHCKECGASAFCEHGKRKDYCRECGGSSFCEHGKWKSYCKKCDGSSLCKTPGCETRRNKKYEGYCLPCFVHVHPDKPNARNYKTKERAVVEFLQTTFAHLTLITDKKVEDGCSRRRPDILIDFGEQLLCIEVDENMHIAYDCSCENKRLMEISKDIGHRPLVFLRFNPDSYKNEKGVLCRSPWGLDGHGVSVIKRATEWEHRLAVLKDQVQYWSEHRTEKTVEVVELFYDMNIVVEEEVDDGTAKGGAGV